MTVDSVANSGHPVAPPSESVVFDASVLQHESNVSNIPKEFMWPEEELFSGEARELSVPIIDLGGFLSGDPVAVMESCKQVQEACEKHGFFLIVNHGVDEEFMTDVHRQLKWFFELPLSEKGRARREFGEYTGYASSLTNRFKSSLPWKETLSLPYIQGTNSVEDYLLKSYGDQFKEFGRINQKLSKSMDTLGLGIMELLGKSLGAGSYFREFFEGHDSILRHNWYPRCQTPHLTLGTGPHTDSVSIAILHQDDVGGLQVQIDNEWFNVSPYPGSFVVNIGETFMALTNGKYKIPLHRAVVNNEKARCSIVFFMNPQADKIIKPPGELVDDEINPRKFPDFTWGALHEFIQKEYRADHNTIHCFFERQQQQKKLKNTSTSSQ